MVRFRVFVLVAAVLLAVASMNAQVTGRITGTVLDQTGAGVPDATVNLQRVRDINVNDQAAPRRDSQ
jgi:hypothetical protein